MDGLTAGQPAPDRLGLHGGERGQHPGEDLQNRIEGVEGLVILAPEPVTIVADVPVRQHIDEVGDGIAGIRNGEIIQGLLHGQNQATQTGQQEAVHFG